MNNSEKQSTDYIKLKDYPDYLDIKKDSIVLINSDARKMIWDAVSNRSDRDLNIFIDSIIEKIGDKGTLIFPTYNWDFCKGIAFDINETQCRTGALGQLALKRSDFRRTKHPIYSFAVCGYYRDYLCSLENTDSFGKDSPFAFFRDKGCWNYIIDVSLKNCFTYVHYVEQSSELVTYRYIKQFNAPYSDGEKSYTSKNYSMFVRDLSLDVRNTIDPLEGDLLQAGAEEIVNINSSSIKIVDLKLAYDVIYNDIKYNSSKKICTYKGQI